MGQNCERSFILKPPEVSPGRTGEQAPPSVPPPPEPAPTAWIDGLRREGLDPWLDGQLNCWVRYHRLCRLRSPSSVVTPLDPRDRKSLFFRQRAWVIGYCRSPHPDEAPNAYLYLCRRQGYDLDALSANTRSKVRRGLRRHRVEPIDERVVAREGYRCFADNRLRNDLTPPSEASFQRFWEGLEVSPFRRIWGAYADGELVGFLAVQLFGQWADNCLLAARTDHLRHYPTNALCFHALHDLLAEPRPLEGVSFGVSSLQPDSHINSLHRYKLSMGFEPVPIVRAFDPHPLLRPLVHPHARALLGFASRLLPHNSVLRKARGLMDFLLTGALPMPGANLLPPGALPSEAEPLPGATTAARSKTAS